MSVWMNEWIFNKMCGDILVMIISLERMMSRGWWVCVYQM